MRKAYGNDLTSYDLLKALAIVLTVLYHLGYYFFPDQYWLFVPGVLIPIWFFLIGYAKSRQIPFFWIVAGLLLMVARVAFGGSILPLNILLFFIAIRLIIDDLAAYVIRSAFA